MVKNPSGTDESTQENDFANLSKTKDFAKFIKIQTATGEIAEDTDIQTLDYDNIRKITSDYHGWVSAGRPKPKLTAEAKGKIRKILSVTRVRHGGKQYLQYVKEGDEIPTGKEWKYQYAQVEQDDGTFVTDTGIIVGKSPHYTIKFTKEEAAKLMDRCKKESMNPKFYLALSNGKAFAIQNHENFLGDFDELWKKASKSEVI